MNPIRKNSFSHLITPKIQSDINPPSQNNYQKWTSPANNAPSIDVGYDNFPSQKNKTLKNFHPLI